MDVSAVQESLARCTVRGGFAAHFVRRLGDAHPPLARALAQGDPAEQHRVLRRGLQMMMLYAQGAPMAVTALDRLAAAAGASAIAVHPDLHPLWVDSLLATVREFDPAFTPGLEKRWREVLGAALTYLAARHRGR